MINVKITYMCRVQRGPGCVVYTLHPIMYLTPFPSALSNAKHVPDLQYLSIGCTDVKSISTFSSNYGCHHERPYISPNFRVLFKIDIERYTMTGAPQAGQLRNLNKLKTFVKGINQYMLVGQNLSLMFHQHKSLAYTMCISSSMPLLQSHHYWACSL